MIKGVLGKFVGTRSAAPDRTLRHVSASKPWRWVKLGGGAMYRPFHLLVPLLLLALAGYLGASDAPPPAGSRAGRAESQADLVIDLRADTPVIRPGDIPRFTAHLVNPGTRAMTVVLPGDGSSCGWRTPVIRWNPPMQADRDCGNSNALKPEDVITLEPGRRVRLNWLGWPTLPGGGTHKVSLVMEHIPDLRWAGVPLGTHDREALREIRRSKGFKAESNVVEVRVRR
jgi:hypothetical protein